MTNRASKAPREIPPTSPQLAQMPDAPDPEAFTGLAGDIVAAIAPHTESATAAILMKTLVMYSAAIGGRQHWRHGLSRHGLNLFAAIVNDQHRARSGCSSRILLEFFEKCDPDFFASGVMPGPPTGESLIHALKDAPVTSYVVHDETTGESRVMFHEQEFAARLAAMQREGNTLSEVMRKAWDGGRLSALSRSGPLVVNGTHVCYLASIGGGDLTPSDLPAGVCNGLANRFLWCLDRRSGSSLLQAPPPDEIFSPLRDRVKAAIRFARAEIETPEVPMSLNPEAGVIWLDAYRELCEIRHGLHGSLTCRAALHVLRLSGLYSLLDLSKEVKAEHLRAGLALWRYCDATAAHISGPN